MQASVLLKPHAVAQGVHGAAHRVPVEARGPKLVERRARRDCQSARALEYPLRLPLLERGMDCSEDAGEESCIYCDFSVTCISYILYFIELKVCFTFIFLNTLL